MGRILIGTSSWADPALTGSGFYPHDLKTPGERLSHYAHKFSLAEMDSSYHFLPTRHNLSIWLESTPPGFIFDIKVFSLFTGHPTPLTAFPRAIRDEVHNFAGGPGRIYINKLPENLQNILWEQFNTAISPISEAGKLGLIIFQFPPWFHPGAEHYNYILHCRSHLDKYHLGIEFRTGDWLDDGNREQTLKFLRDNDLSLVCVDEPQGLKTSVLPVIEATASIAAVRFHGRNRESWEEKGIPAEDKFHYNYSEAELREWEPKLRLLSGQAEAVHVIFKTKPASLAVENALQMQNILGMHSDSV